MRRFLYSRWFFLFLALVCLLDLLTDILAAAFPSGLLSKLSVAADIIPAAMSLWMFFDLQRRKPKNGHHTPR